MSSPHLSRRSVARGAAWSVPVVAIAVAAPAFAASPTYTPTLTVMTGCRCGTGGGPAKPFRLDVTFTNTGTDTFTVTNVDISTAAAGSGTGEALLPATPAQTNTIAPGVKTLSYGFIRGTGNPVTDTVTFAYRATNTTSSFFSDQTVTLVVEWDTCNTSCQ
jgi:hypothetical protein